MLERYREQIQETARPAIHHCMVVHNSYPLGEPRVQREAETLAADNCEVDVICLHHADEPSFERISGVTIYRLPFRRNKNRGVMMQLFEYLIFFALAFAKLTILHWRQHYHIVQVHNLPDFLVFATLIPKLTGSRIILDLHDLMPEFFAGRFSSSRARWLLGLVVWQEKLACRFADHVITVSEHWRQTLIRRGVPAHKCSVLMNLADHRIFKRADDAPVRLNPNGQFHLIYHGTITYRYGLDLLVKAIDLVKAEIPTIKLSLIGGGEYVKHLRQMIQNLQLDQQVQMSGIIPAEKLPPVIAAADLAVVPYRNDIFTKELLPTKLMEYAALGVPAVVSRTPAIAAYFDETMVQFFTPGEVNELAASILDLYRHPARLAALAVNIQKFNQRYSWANQGPEYVQLVQRLAKISAVDMPETNELRQPVQNQ